MHHPHPLLMVAVLAALLFAPTCLQAESPSPPNVLVILTDDQGWGDLSLHGNPNLSTPNIDSLARDGAQLKNFYVCAVCSPTRAELLTGRYHTRMGVFSTSRGGERFDPAERTMGDVFRSAGYRTAAFGKWHSGMQAPYHPNARGFDEFYGFCSGHWGNYFSPMLEHNGEIVTGDGFIIDDLTNHAIQFMNEAGPEPFFVYLPLNTPHSPMQVPGKDWAAFANKAIVPDPSPENAKKEDIVHTRAALALVENIDDNVGRILESLKKTGRAEDTIVVFFCDNGPNGSRFNGGLRGRKGSVYEGGLRSPCLIRWPGKIDAGLELEGIAGAIDLLPTLANLSGIIVGPTRGPLDGVSMANRLRDEDFRKERIPQRTLFTAWNGKTSVRSQRFRLHSDGSLYDITNDRGEQNDVSKRHVKMTEQLSRRLSNWVAKTKPRKSKSKIVEVFPVGHPDFVNTQLPARDATGRGGIKRSSKHPNSSYFTNWTRSTDTINWMVDVLQTGTFEVEMRYAGQPSAVGSQIQLRLLTRDGKSVLLTTQEVTQASDSGVIGRQFDRSPRIEGYDKNWARMSLGKIELPQGKAVLQMSSPKITDDSGIEMRLILLKRLPDPPSES